MKIIGSNSGKKDLSCNIVIIVLTMELPFPKSGELGIIECIKVEFDTGDYLSAMLKTDVVPQQGCRIKAPLPMVLLKMLTQGANSC